jgi:mono/diheme cytochrome c family protein
MRRLEQLCLLASLTLAIAFAATNAGFAQEAGGGTGAVSGRDEYVSSCGACHGPVGKGDGQVAGFLKYKPADLTALARKNKGVFPEKRLEAFIDGTKMIGPHGAREMPVWGREFLKEGSSPEQAKARITALVDYLKSIQEK